MTPFINKPDSSNDSTLFLISIISSFVIINIVLPDPNIFLWIDVSVADVDVVNPNGVKTLLANDLSTSFVKGNPIFSNGSISQPKNPSDYPILCGWVVDSFTLAEELLAKALRSFETCVLVNNNLCTKLFSTLESPTCWWKFQSCLTTIFIPDFNLLSRELDNFTFKV